MTRIARTSAFGVLTGLSIVMSGVCAANADTTTPVTDTFSITASGANQFDTLMFPQFNPSSGTLTSVDFVLSSSISPIITFQGVAAVGPPFVMQSGVGGVFDSSFSGLQPGFTTAFYTGNSQVSIPLVLSSPSGSAATWSGNLTLTYDFTPATAATPLPAALPLFATGLGAFGLLGWRRKRKASASLLGAA